MRVRVAVYFNWVISYQDESFVNDILVPGLETGDPAYKVCLHYRDWVPGEFIEEQIMKSVKASRRTIVVFSKNFLESVWGQMEFKAAHKQALTDKTNRVILIVYGEVMFINPYRGSDSNIEHIKKLISNLIS